MDTTYDLKCDNEFCVQLGACVQMASTTEMLDALADKMTLAYDLGVNDGARDAMIQFDLAQQEEGGQEDTTLTVDVLAAAVEESLIELYENFERVQEWADVVNDNIDELDSDLEILEEEFGTDIIYVEALARRIEDLERQNIELWQAILS